MRVSLKTSKVLEHLFFIPISRRPTVDPRVRRTRVNPRLLDDDRRRHQSNELSQGVDTMDPQARASRGGAQCDNVTLFLDSVLSASIDE